MTTERKRRTIQRRRTLNLRAAVPLVLGYDAILPVRIAQDDVVVAVPSTVHQVLEHGDLLHEGGEPVNWGQVARVDGVWLGEVPHEC